MRYTTAIDLTEIPEIWRNLNACRIYYYLAMRCGYHDEDRDRIQISIRRLAQVTGCSVSATRHAIGVLTRAKLMETKDAAYLVKKFVLEQPVSSRARTKKEQQLQLEAQQRELQHYRLEAQRQEEQRMKTAPTAAEDAAFVRQYEEYLAAPNSQARRGFINAYKKRYEALKNKKG